jgi:hypothetical protein
MVLTAQETRERDQRDVQAHTPTRHKHAEVIHVFTVYFAPSKLACGKRGQTKRSECQVFSKKPTSQHLLRLADALLDPLLESSSVLSPLFRSFEIGRGFIVRIGEHGDDTDEDGLHRVDGQPPLVGLLITPFIVARGMKDGDADFAILIDIGMPDWGCEGQDRRQVGILRRELEEAIEESTLIECISGPNDHNLPFKDVVILQASRETLNRIFLELFELLLQEKRSTLSVRVVCSHGWNLSS